MKSIDYMTCIEDSVARIKKGAFLTVKNQEAMNTMTIGWATIGIVWQKPIMMIAVRPTRHTFTIIDAINNFTVSVPYVDMAKQLAFCGSQSGRDGDKFAECGLTTREAQQVESPIIDCTGLHYECRIVYKSAMDQNNLVEAYESLYPDKDYHTLYFGEIVACYEM